MKPRKKMTEAAAYGAADRRTRERIALAKSFACARLRRVSLPASHGDMLADESWELADSFMTTIESLSIETRERIKNECLGDDIGE